MLDELAGVLARVKFQGRIERAGSPLSALLDAYRDLVDVVVPANITPTIIDDPADDAVLAAALGGYADLIASGDSHLLNLSRFHHVRIITVAQALSAISALGS